MSSDRLMLWAFDVPAYHSALRMCDTCYYDWFSGHDVAGLRRASIIGAGCRSSVVNAMAFADDTVHNNHSKMLKQHASIQDIRS